METEELARKKRRKHQRREAGVLGMWLFLLAEAMFFAGLLFTYFILAKINTAASASELENSNVLLLCGVQGRTPLAGNYWLPEGLQLPVAVTAANTMLLLFSAYFMQKGYASIRENNVSGLWKWMAVTAVAGTTFVGVQGVEWARLLSHGLRAETSVFGALFYTIIGAHALHVTGGLSFLLYCVFQSIRGSYTARDHVSIRLCRMYWFFVVFLWPVLYGLLYFQ